LHNFYRIYDRHQQPMTAIAIFTGPDGHKIPNRYEYHFLGTHHVYQYNTLNISEPTDEELEKSNNPFAIVMLAARKALLAGKIPEKELLEQKLLVAKLLLGKKQFSHKKIKAILTFLKGYIVFDKKETNRIFDKQIKEITHQKNTMGLLEEQIAEIRVEEEKELFVEKMLKKTDFSMSKIADLAGVDLNFVRRAKRRLIRQKELSVRLK